MFGDLLMSDRSLVATCLAKDGLETKWSRSCAAFSCRRETKRDVGDIVANVFGCATEEEAVQTKRVRVVDLLGEPLRARLPRAINVNGCIAALSVS